MNEHIQIILGAILFIDSHDLSELQQQSSVMPHLKDIFILSSFETWLSTTVFIRLHLNECWKDACHQD
jgi:hypothetical protein